MNISYWPAVISGAAALLGAIVGGLLARGTASQSLKIQRLDEYRREVRLAVAALIAAIDAYVESHRQFLDALELRGDRLHVSPRALSFRTERSDAGQRMQTTHAQFKVLVRERALIRWVEGIEARAILLSVEGDLDVYRIEPVSRQQLDSVIEDVRRTAIYDIDNEIRTLSETVSMLYGHTVLEDRRVVRFARKLRREWKSDREREDASQDDHDENPS